MRSEPGRSSEFNNGGSYGQKASETAGQESGGEVEGETGGQKDVGQA